MHITRAAVGDYPILAKINAYDKSADDMQLEEAIVIAKYLEEYGCDAIEVSNGIIEDNFRSAFADLLKKVGIT